MSEIPRDHYVRSIDKVIDEVHAAQRKHGRTFERGNEERKLRILVEEVGEIAEAIQRVESGEERFLDDNLEHLDEEIAQVAACCLRWLAGEP